MGMSASQARLLMLTARKSDLEYQAQQITQAKLALAQKEEEIAVKHNNAISNTEYVVVKSGTEKIPMTYAELKSNGYLLYDSKTWQPIDENQHPQLWLDGGGAESYVKNMIEEKLWVLKEPQNDPETISMTVDYTEVYDHADDAAAEAEYNLETKKIQTKEKQLDMTLKQIETQHTAVTNEMESVEKIVKDNVEKTFKTFA